jgi:hypothetical protein
MPARIYRPAKTFMQSGRAKTRHWELEFEPEDPKDVEPLMGWIASRDTKQQVVLRFPTREAAVAFAEKHGIAYRVFEPRERQLRRQSYADNFKRPIL